MPPADRPRGVSNARNLRHPSKDRSPLERREWEPPARKDSQAMKMIVAYIDGELFEPIRIELLALGFVSLSVVDASGSVPEPTVSGQYRGVTIEQHVRPKARLECIVGADQVPTVIE